MRLDARGGVLALTLLAACGGGGGSGAGGAGGAGGAAGDGKYHPAANGVAMSEADACNALSNAADQDNTTLSCVSTSPSCPELLRDQFTTACLQYDQGTVLGCVAYYGMATTCQELASAVSSCAVAPLVGSAPKGCP